MTNAAPACPHCREAMDEGFLLDRKRNGADSGVWVEGQPVRSFLTGLEVKGRAAYRITAFRCGRCGFLASYAREPAGKKGPRS